MTTKQERYRAAHPERVAESQRKYYAKNREKIAEYQRTNPERTARSCARQLMQGERIVSVASHHRGMAKLKEWMGDPRPEGMTLSLVDPDSPSAYVGRNASTERPYILSTNPADYVWESIADNIRRGKPTTFLIPGTYTSDDLDRIVAGRDRP